MTVIAISEDDDQTSLRELRIMMVKRLMSDDDQNEMKWSVQSTDLLAVQPFGSQLRLKNVVVLEGTSLRGERYAHPLHR